ncbi:hypothetical protein C8Q80DRAFT_1124104 [Daedaleopsis nitida]|nr:hypothetical protein C8Q80DRAFT_1124104 [Daedaleopsis nitida]
MKGGAREDHPKGRQRHNAIDRGPSQWMHSESVLWIHPEYRTLTRTRDNHIGVPQEVVSLLSGWAEERQFEYTYCAGMMNTLGELRMDGVGGSEEATLLEQFQTDHLGDARLYLQGLDVTLDLTVIPADSRDLSRATSTIKSENYANVVVFTTVAAAPPRSFGCSGDLWLCATNDTASLHLRGRVGWEQVPPGLLTSTRHLHPLSASLELVYHDYRLRWYTHGTAINKRSEYKRTPTIFRPRAHSLPSPNPTSTPVPYHNVTVAEVVQHCTARVIRLTALAPHVPPVCRNLGARRLALKAPSSQWPNDAQIQQWQTDRQLATLLASSCGVLPTAPPSPSTTTQTASAFEPQPAIDFSRALPDAAPVIPFTRNLDDASSSLSPPPASSSDRVTPAHIPFLDPSLTIDALMPPGNSSEFPSDHHASCTWWNGMTTLLPFLTESKPVAKGHDTYEPGDPDVRMVQWAARCSSDPTVASDPSDPKSQPMVEVLDNASDMSDEEFAFKIRACLGSGRAVLVTNYTNTDSRTPLLWNECTATRPSTGAELRARRRERSRRNQKPLLPEHVTTDMADFLKTADDPTVCGNLLDIPLTHANLPWFISMVSDDLRAETTLRRTPPKDMERMRHWALMANGGFVTHLHHDTHGLATWVAVTSGGKMWTLVRPRSGDAADVEELLIKIAEAPDETCPGAIPLDKVDIATVPLLPRSVLIQGPGSFHMVYTPVKTVAIGGHFLALDTLPQTLMTRMVQAKTTFCATNATHLGVLSSLARMAIALDLRTHVNKGVFASLMFLIQNGDHFPLDKRGRPTKPDDEHYLADQQEALDIVERIRRHNRLPKLLDPDAFPWPNPYYDTGIENLDIPSKVALANAKIIIKIPSKRPRNT